MVSAIEIMTTAMDFIRISHPDDYREMAYCCGLTQKLFPGLLKEALPPSVELVACHPHNAIDKSHLLAAGARSQYVCTLSATICEHPKFEETCKRYGILVIVDSRGEPQPQAHVFVPVKWNSCFGADMRDLGGISMKHDKAALIEIMGSIKGIWGPVPLLSVDSYKKLVDVVQMELEAMVIS